MALDIKGLKRVFILKKGNDTLTLEDPDSRMSLSEVTDFYSMNYPELTTATLHGPELEEDRAVPVQNHHRNERISHGKENKP